MSEVKQSPAQPCAKADIEWRQLDLFEGRSGPASLDGALWSRRQSRRDNVVINGVAGNEGLLVPLILALARLSAQRDARAIAGSHSHPGIA